MSLLNHALITERIGDLHLEAAEIASAVGLKEGWQDGSFPSQWGQFELKAAFKLAALLCLHPGDVFHVALEYDEDSHAEGLLNEFVLAGGGGHPETSAQLLRWALECLKRGRRGHRPSRGTAMGVALALDAEAPGRHTAPVYRTYFAARTAPDPYDAADLLRLLAPDTSGTGAVTGYAPRSVARRMAATGLVLIEPTDGKTTPLPFDAVVAPGPDMLYALDLIPAPGPAPHPDPATTSPEER